MKYFDKKVEDFLYSYFISNFEVIRVESGKCRFNYKCHMNTVNDALNNDDDKLAMVVYIDDNYIPWLHFINFSDGVFIDNTIGRWSETYEYRLIRMIDKSEFFSINAVFTRYLEATESVLPFFYRLLRTKKQIL